ncbi:unnamed protein product, partial [Scytosiphon promiscuus]
MSTSIKVTAVLHSLDPPRLGLRHPYSNALIAVYKAVPGSLFDYSSRLWHFPMSAREEVLQRVRKVAGTEIEDIPPFVETLLASAKKDVNDGFAAQEMEDEIRLRTESVPEALMSTLYPFQVRCLMFAIKKKGKLLLGDEMGLGKTLQALAVACAYREDWPVLVVAPSSLRANWKKEATKWVPGLTEESIQVVKDAKAGVRDSALLVIVSYDLASRMVEKSLLWKGQFQFVIADESHYLKSIDAKRSQAVVPLMQKALRAICVTGTPALSRPAELFMQLKALMPGAFKAFHPFAVRYCAAFQGPFGFDTSGSSNTAELKMILEEVIMIRRLKEEVLSDMLPEKDRQIVDVAVDEKVMKKVAELMEQKVAAHDALKSVADDAEKFQLLGEIRTLTSKLYSTSGSAKVKGVIAHLRTLLTGDDDHTGEKNGTTQKQEESPPATGSPASIAGTNAPSPVAEATIGDGGGGRCGNLAPAAAPPVRRGPGGLWNSSGGGVVGEEWACPRCTYSNPASSRPSCDMCGTPRPKATVAAAAVLRTGGGAKVGRVVPVEGTDGDDDDEEEVDEKGGD